MNYFILFQIFCPLNKQNSLFPVNSSRVSSGFVYRTYLHFHSLGKEDFNRVNSLLKVNKRK